MDARIATTIAEFLRATPADGPARRLALQRLTTTWADAEATAAVRAAAARARDALRSQPGTDAHATANAISAASALRELDAASPADPIASLAEREQLAHAITDPGFLANVPDWISELRTVAAERPGTGACTAATAMQLWLWTISHARRTMGDADAPLTELAETFARLIAARAQILEIAAEGAPGRSATRQFYTDLSHVEAARAAGVVATTCAEIVFGYRAHPAWDSAGCSGCYQADDLDTLEGWIPGIASSARAHSDVIEADGSHAAKAGPCAGTHGVEMFLRLRAKLDGCLTGARRAKDRAAAALPSIIGETAGATP